MTIFFPPVAASMVAMIAFIVVSEFSTTAVAGGIAAVAFLLGFVGYLASPLPNSNHPGGAL